MDFDNIAHWLIAFGWLISIILVWHFAKKRDGGETLLSKLFQSNKDLDTTLELLLKGSIVFAVLIIVVVFFSMFHDDLDASPVGMLASQVVGMAGVAIAGITGNGNKNGKPPDKE